MTTHQHDSRTLLLRLGELQRLRGRLDAEIQVTVEAIARTAGLEAETRTTRRHRSPAKCGTPSGYYRHRRRLKEPACDACKAAHSAAEAVRMQKRRAEAKAQGGAA